MSKLLVPLLLLAPAGAWERLPVGQCQSGTCSEGPCTKCEGVPTTSVCKMANGFDFGSSITTSATDSSYLLEACKKIADGDLSGCDNIQDAGFKGACKSITNGGNAISIWAKRSCHTDHGGDADYNYCNVYTCTSNPVLSDLDGHCDESVGCQGTFMMYTKLDGPTPTPTPQAKCDESTNTCQMVAPYGKEITDPGQGYPPSSFKTWDGCRFGCQLTTSCQSFSFDDASQACKWYAPSSDSTGDQGIWEFRMGVENFDLDESQSPPVINHGTVHGITVNTPAVSDQNEVSKTACEEAYADLWASVKSGKSSIQLGPGDSLIGGYASGCSSCTPKAGDWFGIAVSQIASLPPKYLKVSLTYQEHQSSGLQATGYSPGCDGKALVANPDGSTILVASDSPQAQQFKWTMPQDAPGVFAGVGGDGNGIGALRADTTNGYAMVVTKTCGGDDDSCGLVTQDYEKMLQNSKLNQTTDWIWTQPDFLGGRAQGCIKMQSGQTCSVPLNGDKVANSDCDNGWQFIVDAEGVSGSSLKDGELGGNGRCVIYKLSALEERLEQSVSDVHQECSTCADRYGKFACITSGSGDHCHLVPSSSFCQNSLGGTFCNPLPPSPSPSPPSGNWGRLPVGQCKSDTCSEGPCTKCEGVPITSVCKMANGFDFGSSITSSATDSSHLLEACKKIADGDLSGCDSIQDAGFKGACKSITQGGNAISIWAKRSCHTDHGGDADYNYCNVYTCDHNPALSDLDGHCDESVGCQGTFEMYTTIASDIIV